MYPAGVFIDSRNALWAFRRFDFPTVQLPCDLGRTCDLRPAEVIATCDLGAGATCDSGVCATCDLGTVATCDRKNLAMEVVV